MISLIIIGAVILYILIFCVVCLFDHFNHYENEIPTLLWYSLLFEVSVVLLGAGLVRAILWLSNL